MAELRGTRSPAEISLVPGVTLLVASDAALTHRTPKPHQAGGRETQMSLQGGGRSDGSCAGGVHDSGVNLNCGDGSAKLLAQGYGGRSKGIRLELP